MFIPTFEFREDEEFDRLINTSFHFEEDSEINEMFEDIARESFTNELEEHVNKFHIEKFEEEEEFASVYYTTTFELQECEEFDRLFNKTTIDFEEDGEFDKINEEEKVAKMFYTTNSEFKESKEFDRMFNNTTFRFEEDERFDMMFDIASRNFTDEFKEQANKFLTDKFEQNTDNQEVQCPVLRGGYNHGEFKAFTQKWALYARCKDEMDDRELR